MMRNLALLVAIVAVANIASAQVAHIDSISGTCVTDSIIVIYGSGFGTKSPAKPVIWDDFEGEWEWPNRPGNRANSPQGIPADGSTFSLADSAAIGSYHYNNPGSKYTSVGVLSGNRSFYQTQVVGYSAITPEFASRFSWTGDPSNDAHQGIISLAAKIKLSNQAVTPPIAVKVGRLAYWPDDQNPNDGVPTGQMGSNVVSAEGIGFQYPTFLGPSYPNPPWPMSVPGSNHGDLNDKWFTNSMWVKLGNAENQTGFAARDFSGWYARTADADFYDGAEPNNHHGFRCFSFFMYTHHISLTAVPEIWMDEVYGDTSLAHVVMHDPTKEGVCGTGGGLRAMQIPVEWSDTEITIVVNTSAYPNDTVLDLIVYNTNGIPSDPFQVVVSSTIDPPDVTPTELTVTRDGTEVTFAWSAEQFGAITFDHYQLEVKVDDVLKTIPVKGTTSAVLTIPAASDIRVRVCAITNEGAGQRETCSAWEWDGGS